MKATAALLLLALLAAPAAALPTAHVTYTMVSPEVMEVAIEASVEGHEASGQRRLLDTDRDGNVTLAEVRKSANSTMSQVNQVSGAISVPGGRTTLDGREQARTFIARIDIDAVGPVNATGPVRQSWLVRLVFPAPGNQSFILGIDPTNTSRAGNIPMKVASATIRPPPGHIVAATGGLPITATSDASGVQLPSGFPTNGKVEVRFAPGQASTTAPASFSPLLAIAALAAALLASRWTLHLETSIHKR